MYQLYKMLQLVHKYCDVRWLHLSLFSLKLTLPVPLVVQHTGKFLPNFSFHNLVFEL